MSMQMCRRWAVLQYKRFITSPICCHLRAHGNELCETAINKLDTSSYKAETILFYLYIINDFINGRQDMTLALMVVITEANVGQSSTAALMVLISPH